MIAAEVFHTLVLVVLIRCETSAAIASDSSDLSPHSDAGRNYLYLNYKEVYGLRYDPKSGRKKANANEVVHGGAGNRVNGDHRPIERSSTTTTDDVVEMISISPLSFTVDAADAITASEPSGGDGDRMVQAISLDTTLNAASHGDERHTAAKNQNFTETAAEQTTAAAESSATATASSSSLRNILGLVRTRLRQWLSLGNGSASNGERFLSVFNVIQFENSACASTKSGYGDVSGICYPDYQCSQMGGLVIDYCADGMGACCICESAVGGVAFWGFVQFSLLIDLFFAFFPVPVQTDCGKTTKYMTSYFQNPGWPAASQERLICTLTVEIQPGVQQVQLDFVSFEVMSRGLLLCRPLGR